MSSGAKQQTGSSRRTVFLIAAFFVVVFFACGTLPVIGGSILFDQLWFLPGDGSRFDPLAALPAAQDYAGDAYQLTTLVAQYVRVDGTLDLRADYGPEVEYRFYRQVQAEGAPPIGAGGSASGLQYEVVVVEMAFDDAMMAFINLGMDRDTRLPTNNKPGDPVGPPRCAFQDLWQVALTKDAPPTAVATITYSADGYVFRIQDTPINLRFDGECQLIA